MKPTDCPDALAWILQEQCLNAFLEGTASPETLLVQLSTLHPDALNTEVLLHLHHAIWQRQVPDFQNFAHKPTVLLDTCGTGGSGRSGFNTSTSVAFILASMGIPVLKFGNRAATSASGSFDFLDALGLKTPLANHQVFPLFEATGLSFLMAPQVYPFLAALVPFRKTLAHPTVFNYLGPCLNPTLPTHRILGCSHAGLLAPLGELLSQPLFQNQYTLLVRSQNGLDEADPQDTTKGLYIHPNTRQKRPLVLEMSPWSIPMTPDPTPEDFSPPANALRFLRLIQGKDTESVIYGQVLYNTALAWQLLHPKESLNSAMERIKDALVSGQTQRYVEHFQSTLQRFA